MIQITVVFDHQSWAWFWFVSLTYFYRDYDQSLFLTLIVALGLISSHVELLIFFIQTLKSVCSPNQPSLGFWRSLGCVHVRWHKCVHLSDNPSQICFHSRSFSVVVLMRDLPCMTVTPFPPGIKMHLMCLCCV